MITVIGGIVGMALLFGLFTYLRPRDKDGCTGNCAGCTRDGACDSEGAKR